MPASQILTVSSNPLMFLAGRHTALISASFFMWYSTLCDFPSVLFSSHEDIGYREFNTCLNLYDLIITN